MIRSKKKYDNIPLRYKYIGQRVITYMFYQRFISINLCENIYIGIYERSQKDIVINLIRRKASHYT